MDSYTKETFKKNEILYVAEQNSNILSQFSPRTRMENQVHQQWMRVL